jgi:hypothetical protein
MRHPDAERPNGTGHPMPVAMILLLPVAVQMDVRTAIVVVTVDVPPFPVQFPRQGPAESDQQEPHTGLRNELKPVRDAKIPCQHHCPDKEESCGMADPPPKTYGS